MRCQCDDEKVRRRVARWQVASAGSVEGLLVGGLLGGGLLWRDGVGGVRFLYRRFLDGIISLSMTIGVEYLLHTGMS